MSFHCTVISGGFRHPDKGGLSSRPLDKGGGGLQTIYNNGPVAMFAIKEGLLYVLLSIAQHKKRSMYSVTSLSYSLTQTAVTKKPKSDGHGNIEL